MKNRGTLFTNNINSYFSNEKRLLYGCTTWTLTKRMEKRLDCSYTRMLQAILNKSRRQQPPKNQQLHGHQSPIRKTIK